MKKLNWEGGLYLGVNRCIKNELLMSSNVRKYQKSQTMNFKLFCIFALFILNITIHGLVENSHIQIRDFRYTKTICMPGYNYWSNEVNDLRYADISTSPYIENQGCWVSRNNISFSQPYLPYEIIVFLDIFIFVVGLFFI